MLEFICIRNAKEHNLCGIDLDLPKNKLIVITGLSGSGKSSLAFDTIYAEGQRRYVESLSAYARQFLNLQDKPDVESITGLSPAISINQKAVSKNPRSTVSTVTEIYDYLRLMYARIGIPYSPVTGKPIAKQLVSQMVDSIIALPVGTKIYILSMIVRGRKGEHNKEIHDIKRQGFSRLKIDGYIYEIDGLPQLDPNKKHDISVVVDRIVVSEDFDNRIPSSIESALKLGNGVMYVEIVSLPEDYQGSEYTKGQVLVFSENFACPESGFTIEEIEPRLFSFNSPYGSCNACDGLGKKLNIDVNLLIPDSNLSIADGAIALIGPLTAVALSHKALPFFSRYCANMILSLAKHYDIDLNKPWVKLEERIKNFILFGTENEEILISYQDEDSNSNYSTKKVFPGLINILEDKQDIVVERAAERYHAVSTCNVCRGFRLKSEALSIKINKEHIGELVRFTVNEAILWIKELPSCLSKQHNEICNKLLSEIAKRLQFLQDVGLDYLTLDRESCTLSGGESQRIRLASQIGSGLTGVLYVLDEPSIGLHQCDNDLLINTLRNLRDIGNTVIVVEHDEDTIMSADYIVDIGPGAGKNGGRLIAQGTPEDIKNSDDSITGQYLSGKKIIPIPKALRSSENFIEVLGASENNLRNIDVKFPLGNFICITGVSGSGKSSLVIDTLYQYVAKKLNNSNGTYGQCKMIKGLEHIDKIIEIDQSPIGRTPLSNPATYTGLFTHIRTWFAGLPEAKARGYSIGRFSFNAKGGRCEACKGDGQLKIEMHFLPDIYVMCEQCKGLRYSRETLEITYKGKSISDVLNMTVDQAIDLFENLPLIKEKLVSLQNVGMGYIKIGQSSTTLSGGEAQRIKLSKELSKRSTGKTLYILDEPTTGLHFEDINHLLKVLHQLVDLGNTVMVIEHNLHVIKTADYVVDIGPGGGVRGGRVVASGTPNEIINVPESITGTYLKPYMMSR